MSTINSKCSQIQNFHSAEMMAPVETTPHVTGLRKDSGYTILQNCSQADRNPRVPQIPSPAELCFYSKLVLL